MAQLSIASANIFEAIANVDVDILSELPETDLRPILPCLVRMSLCGPLDMSDKWTVQRKKILKCLQGIEVVNSLVGLLSIDFHALEQDARKEQQLRYFYDVIYHCQCLIIAVSLSVQCLIIIKFASQILRCIQKKK